MYSPLVPTPSRPPPPDPTAEPASGSRGALPHRIAPRWGGTWPDGSGHYGQWSKGEAGKEGWEGGAVGGVAPGRMCTRGTGDPARGSAPSVKSAAFGPPRNTGGSGSFLGRLPWTVSAGNPTRRPGSPPPERSPLVSRVPLRRRGQGGSRAKGRLLFVSSPAVRSSRPHPPEGSAIRDLPTPKPHEWTWGCHGWPNILSALLVNRRSLQLGPTWRDCLKL